MGREPECVVGRAAEVGYLEQCLETTLRGERQVAFVSGEPGIGKTTIVDTFLARLCGRTDLRIGHGQCIEQYGAGEAYLPLLGIAGQLCRGPGTEQARQLLRRYAPSWLVQLSFLVDAAEIESLRHQLQSSSRERMLREAAEVISAFTRHQGLVLVLEDLHWSDVSTLEWLSYIAQRREPAKLLIIATYRPTEVLGSGHPLRGVVQELTTRGCGEELRVMPLSERAVSDYLASRLSPAIAASPLPGLIHRRTGGNPLFVVSIVDDLLQQGLVREEVGQWLVQGGLLSITESVPDSLRQVIGQQVERLPATLQQLLEVASVVGVEFSAAAVAAGLQAPVEDIDHQCEVLARREQFILARGTEEWPDGTLSERYSFRHALYHAALYERLTATQRVRLHRRIAERKEAAHGEQAGEIAAELASHFAAGRDPQKASRYHGQAGETALRRNAYQEAMDHFTKGLTLLQTLPDTPERTHHEIQLHLSYAMSLIVTKGSATSEVEQAYTHAWKLCQQIRETPLLFPVLKGLWVLHDTRAENGRARELAEQFLTLAQRAADPISLSQAYYALGWTLFKLGELVSARTCLEESISCYPPAQHSAPSFSYGQDTGMNCLSFASLDLWFLGYPDQALQRSQEALALARESSHPYSKAFALCVAAGFHQYRREAQAVRAQVETIVTLSTQYGFPAWSAAGAILGGWVVAEQGWADEGITQMHQGIATWRTIGAEEFTPYWLALLAQAYGKSGQPDEGLRQLAEALKLVDKTEERFYEAELYRLKGELLLAQQIERQKAKIKSQNLEVLDPQSQIPNLDPQGEAEVGYQQALAVARKQQAKSLELRASVSLARLWQSQGKGAEARTVLKDIYGWFTEGFDTKDLQEAAALLRALGSTVESPGNRQRTTGNGQPAAVGERVESIPRSAATPLVPASHSSHSSTQHLPSNTEMPLPDTRSPMPDPPCLFLHEGDYWTLSFQGTVCRVRHILGMQYIAQLLHHPHREFHVLALVSGGAEYTQAIVEVDRQSNPVQIHYGLSDAGELLDAQARAAYKRRLQELREELEEAQTFHDVGRAEKIQEEIDLLAAEISRAVGLGGRRRKAASPAERARVNVTLAIKTALKRIIANHPALGQYLARTIKTGYACLYAPEPYQPVVWQF